MMSEKLPHAVDDRKFEAEPVYLSDLSKCTPSSALSQDRRRGYWNTLRYETDQLSGVMLLAGSKTSARDITYPLNLSGWHSGYGCVIDRKPLILIQKTKSSSMREIENNINNTQV